MADSGSVAGLLWDRWLPRQVQLTIAEALPGGVRDARRLVVWSAAVHDVGKATPAFACQVESLASRMRDAGLGMPVRQRLLDRELAPHGLAGQVLLQDWLQERFGWSRRAAVPFAIAVGGHHGVPPTSADIKAVKDRPRLLRDPSCETRWRSVQEELLEACAEACGVMERLAVWRGVRLPQPAQALVSGLVIVADWIASNPDLFPYFPDAVGISDEERIRAGWQGLALPDPWQAVEPVGHPSELFAARFSLPPTARVRPVQERAIDAARTMGAAGLMVIEAPMGEGKTEAALAVAEIFAARSGAGEVYTALPRWTRPADAGCSRSGHDRARRRGCSPRMRGWHLLVGGLRLSSSCGRANPSCEGTGHVVAGRALSTKSVERPSFADSSTMIESPPPWTGGGLGVPLHL